MGTEATENRLSAALFSRNRRAILGLLFGHVDEAFYLRQVVRASGGGVGAVQRELKQLVAAGILRRDVRGNQVYFQADRDCPIFDELNRILVKTSGVADVLRAALGPLADRISVAWIHGSVARGEESPASDVDVLVVGDVSFGEVVTALLPAQEIVRREVNPTVYPPDEFRSKIKAGHHFLTRVLKQTRIFLIGDEHDVARLAEKPLAHGT